MSRTNRDYPKALHGRFFTALLIGLALAGCSTADGSRSVDPVAAVPVITEPVAYCYQNLTDVVCYTEPAPAREPVCIVMAPYDYCRPGLLAVYPARPGTWRPAGG